MHMNSGDITAGLLLMTNIYGRVLAGENAAEALPPINEAGFSNGLRKIAHKWPAWIVWTILVGIPAFVIAAILVCAALFAFRRYCARQGRGYAAGRPTGHN
ncbi:hypothetical protein M3Y99_01559800 [Aphelenchoides fujianensis]|nr:hypothetical protein M3Y99_01559800 [Aphelenchoides fujianensis]